jgi:cobalamin biosynthesis protein CobD/CbiB
MFSRTPHAPAQHEILYLGEAFTWQEDASVTERRRREREKQIWTTCVGAALALLVLGHAFGISWLVSAVASGVTTSVQMR